MRCWCSLLAGLLLNPFMELGVVVLVLLLPILKNRVQHIEFAGPPAAVVVRAIGQGRGGSSFCFF